MSREIWKPKPISREAVLESFGEDSGKWRNPVRIATATGSWPKPQDDRARAYEKILGTSSTWSEKGRP